MVSSTCSISLTHCGRVTHICVSKLTIIGSDNGLSPDRRQAIIWTNAGILLIGPLGTNFSEILIGIQTFSFTKMRLKMSSAKWSPFCGGTVALHCISKLVALIVSDRVCEHSLFPSPLICPIIRNICIGPLARNLTIVGGCHFIFQNNIDLYELVPPKYHRFIYSKQ